jgi:hypothetical protein
MEFPRYARCQITWKIQNISAQILQNPRFPSVESQMFSINLRNPSWGFAATKWWVINA